MCKMDQLKGASKHLQQARDLAEECVAAQDKWAIMLTERMAKLNGRKQNTAATYGYIHSADDVLVIVNAGGNVISAKRNRAACGEVRFPCPTARPVGEEFSTSKSLKNSITSSQWKGEGKVREDECKLGVYFLQAL